MGCLQGLADVLLRHSILLVRSLHKISKSVGCDNRHSNTTPLFGLSVFLPSIIQGLGYKGATAQLMTVPVCLIPDVSWGAQLLELFLKRVDTHLDVCGSGDPCHCCISLLGQVQTPRPVSVGCL
jgi:hypothetical protein